MTPGFGPIVSAAPPEDIELQAKGMTQPKTPDSKPVDPTANRRITKTQFVVQFVFKETPLSERAAEPPAEPAKGTAKPFVDTKPTAVAPRPGAPRGPGGAPAQPVGDGEVGVDSAVAPPRPPAQGIAD